MPKRTDIKKIMLIGAGPIVIGQACEFDYSGTQACKALREEGYEVVLVNSNPATIMTDPDTADRTYIEPLVWELVEKVIAKERPDAILPTLGGQTGLNLAMDLARHGVPVAFVAASAIPAYWAGWAWPLACILASDFQRLARAARAWYSTRRFLYRSLNPSGAQAVNRGLSGLQ